MDSVVVAAANNRKPPTDLVGVASTNCTNCLIYLVVPTARNGCPEMRNPVSDATAYRARSIAGNVAPAAANGRISSACRIGVRIGGSTAAGNHRVDASGSVVSSPTDRRRGIARNICTPPEYRGVVTAGRIGIRPPIPPP